ncbi:hypothetical protein XM38_010030 [Halomicronema hongdechloris C2206]|uniref:Uncharacterized protein n=1 Tax=Halomicronema hongdechloris C2206 TaxID=1641165 RepID=A0A1Z3HIG4_9CYAN|nr:Sll0314/Alr1548 family TPR repeat-containing protein [Halomicronema hongdechloris]ASC70073.1 hypothetical protein XM38_010030 [Halomicronema hongdechloris C2206]
MRRRRRWVATVARHSHRWSLAAVAAAGLSWGLAIPVALAGDPFRSNDSHAIGDRTPRLPSRPCFRMGIMWKRGRSCLWPLRDEAQEPMVHAMLAAMAYLDEDWEILLQRAQSTQRTADALLQTDPLRGHLYAAVGIFLEGAHLLKTEGEVSGMLRALTMLDRVFRHLDQAEAIDANDPELSLIKGYMDLMLAVNLPFSDPEVAIERLRNHGAPDYLAERGIALGYRDLDRNQQALEAVNQALQGAPQNPELFYLKAQILRRLGQDQDSVSFFTQALDYAEQLPQPIVRRIAWERCRTEREAGVNCTAQVRDILSSL